MNILAFNIGVRGSAACLLRDGRSIATAREEWFSRMPFDAAQPDRAVDCCLESAGLEPGDVDTVVRAGRSEGRLATLSSWFGSLSEGAREGGSLFGRLRRAQLGPVGVVAEAQAALAGAFYPSPYEAAAVLVLNGPGQGLGSAAAVGEGTRIRILTETPAPHGPGTLYAALAARLGRRYPQDEAELVDLGRLGRPQYVETVRRDWIEFLDDGTCRAKSEGTASPEFFGPAGESRRANFSQYHMDLARSVQTVFEEALLHAAKHLRRASGLKSLALAGDAALNTAAVGRLLREGIFDEVWIPPSPCDGALGAALDTWYRAPGRRRATEPFSGYSGPVFNVPALESYIVEMKIAAQRFRADELVAGMAAVLGGGRTVGWFQGRMWSGPHGLAARAVLADPRSGPMRDFLNTRVKRRGGFRTFTAAVLAEQAAQYFDLRGPTPYGYAALPLRRPGHERGGKRLATVQEHLPLALAGVMQIDGTVSLRLVDKKAEPLFHALLNAFAERTGCPVLLTDSLCLDSEPPAATPRDAYACFMRTDLDHLVMGPFLIDKRQQPLWDDRA